MPPVQMAKTLATLDVVSEGRVLYGVGSGWMDIIAQAVDLAGECQSAGACYMSVSFKWRSSPRTACDGP
jgi:Luciferase-like monooxygenase